MSSPVETQGQKRLSNELSRLEEYTVVDIDVHEIIPDKDKFVQYIDEPWRSKVNHLQHTKEPLGAGLRGTQPLEVDITPHGLDDEVSPLHPEGLHNFMDRFNTDYIIFHGHEIEGVNIVPEKEYAAALCSGYNDFLLDNYLDDNEGFKGVIRVPPQAPELAVEEVERLSSEKNMVGIHIPAYVTNGLLGDQIYEPIYEIAQEKGLPIDYHPTSPNQQWAYPWGGPWLQSTVEATAGMSHHMMSHIPSLIFQGIPEKYPDVQHVFIEAGIAWLPSVLGRMDKNYERCKDQFSHLSKKPSEYCREFFHFGTQPIEDPAGPHNIAKLLEIIGAEDMLMFSSDFPHFDYDIPSILTIPQLDEDAERKIFGQNALDVYAF